MMLHSQVAEVDSGQIETVTENNVIPCRTQPTYSKYPNQLKLLVKMKNVSFLTKEKKPKQTF